jgi:translation initiation factor RLI1
LINKLKGFLLRNFIKKYKGMKIKIVVMVAIFTLVSCKNEAQTSVQPKLTSNTETMNKENIYQFKVKDLSGNELKKLKLFASLIMELPFR